MGPDDLLVSLGPSQPQKKKNPLARRMFGPILLGGFMGLLASLMESTMKDPFKLMFDLFGFFPMASEMFRDHMSTVWFGITNFKLYYILVGLFFILAAIVLGLFGIGMIIGAFLGGVFYWFLSIAQP